MYNLGGVKLTCRSLAERENCERSLPFGCIQKCQCIRARARARTLNSVCRECVCVCMCAVINSRCLPSVTENANAPDDSGIRAKEARRENRTLRRGACQVSPKTPLTKSARMNDGSAIVEQFRYLLPRPIITIAFLPNPNAQANVSEKTYPEDHIYCAFLHFFH